MTDRRLPGAVPSITILTGEEPHADPWHALSLTSSAIAATLADLGKCVEVPTTELAEGAFADTDLVVVNASGDLAQSPPESRAIVDALVRHHQGGGPVLAVHSSSLAFRDDPRWAQLVGGRWVTGRSTHPQIGTSVVQLTAAAHPITAGLADFVVYDERYTALEVHPSAEVLAFHTEDGVTHTLSWAVEGGDGRQGRVVYDALGHGVESYDYAGRRDLLVAAARWLLDGDGSLDTVGDDR